MESAHLDCKEQKNMKKLRYGLLFFCLSLSVVSCKSEKTAEAPPPPPEVKVIQTEAVDVPIYQEFVGQVFGLKDIAIRARVEGFLEGIHFKEGSRVKKGQLLYTMESQPFEAEVAAKMSMVAEAKTMLAKAKSDLGRIRPLAAEKAVSQSDLDGAVARYEAAIASVKAARANLKASKILLGYTKIYSPLTGIIGRTQAKVGDFVGRSPNPVLLNTVSRIDTVLVQFFITEVEYLKFARRFKLGSGKSRNGAGKPSLELILADGSVYEHRGKLDFVDREVDPSTGSMLVQASFPNPDELLRPGQFAKVRAMVKMVRGGILIPQRCVIELQGLHSVYVVDKDNKAHNREVKVGAKVKGGWLIREGLKPGEHVVYEGLQVVRDGLIVKPVVAILEPAGQKSGSSRDKAGTPTQAKEST